MTCVNGLYTEEAMRSVRGNFDWRDLESLGKLFAYVVTVRFHHARSTRWKGRHEFRRSSLPNR